MSSQKQLLFAYGLAVHLLIMGIVCYVVFYNKTHDKPIRIMYKTAAGKVLFDHNNHHSSPGYGISCNDCHHHPSDSDEFQSCKNCHKKDLKNVNDFSIKSCLDCHDLEDIENTEMFSRTDAFHNQCIKCHSDIESGPKECSQCHIL